MAATDTTLKTFRAEAFPADSDLIFEVDAEQDGALYEIWEVRSDSPNARKRTSALPEKIARQQAAEWTDESVGNYLSERLGPNKVKVVKKYAVVKVETIRTLVTG